MSVQIHFKRLITLLGIAFQPGSYTMVAKEGLDGSGRHAIYNQLGNVETHNMTSKEKHSVTRKLIKNKHFLVTHNKNNYNVSFIFLMST